MNRTVTSLLTPFIAAGPASSPGSGPGHSGSTVLLMMLLVGGLFTAPAAAQEFTDSGQSLGDGHTEAVATGDLDGDGNTDLVIGNGSTFDIDTPNTVWLNDGTGSFTDTGQSLGVAHTQDLALADVDGDGDLDLIAANGMPDGESGGKTNKVWLNDGTGSFTDTGQGFGPYDTSSIAVADLDGDGDLDFVSGREGFSDSNAVWFNDGSGTFSSEQFLGDGLTTDVALADVDGDDDPDLLAGNNQGIGGSRNVLWLNDGAGTFSESGETFSLTNTYAVAFADLDGDGAPDIVDGVRADASGNEVWMNDGNGTFTNTQNFGGNAYTVAIAVGDLDGDGDPDLVEGKSTFGAGGQPNRVWTNDNGTFTDTGQTLADNETFGLSVADTDGDGDKDFVAGNGGGTSDGAPSKVWLNAGEGGNQPPTAMDDSYSTPENSTLTVDPPGVLGNDSDPDGDPLEASVVSGVSNGTLTLNADGAFTYDPASGFTGTDSFEYEAADGNGGADPATVTISVNAPPVAENDADQTGAGQPTTTDVLANDSDPDGDGLAPSSVQVEASPTDGSASANDDGTITYDPGAGFTGEDSYTYTVADQEGARSGEATVTISVESNSSPTASFTFDPSVPNVGETVAFDGSGSSDSDGSIAVYQWDFDGDGETDATGQTTSTTFASAGDKAVTLTVEDDDGATGEATETVPVNAFPTASDDSDETEEGQSVTTDVLVNDSDPDGDGLDPSSVQIESSPSNGAASANDDGTITYDPDAGFTGEDSYTYTVADQEGAESDPATVTITVVPGNDPPVVDIPLPDDTLETPGPPLTLTGLGTTVFDDPDGDSLTFSATSDAPGVVEAIGESPEVAVLQPSGTGTAQVTVTASDGIGETSTSFSVTVESLEGEEPVAQVTATVASAGDGKTFDFGETGNKIVPLVLEGSGSIDVQRFDSPPDGTDGIDEPNVSQYRVVISMGGDLALEDDTELRFPVEDFSGIDDPTEVTVYRRPTPGAGTFEELNVSVDESGTSEDPSDDEIVAETGSFSEFVLASGSGALPVELAAFTATLDGTTARLQWRTASETNNARFEVQHRAPNAATYTTVGSVESKVERGTTSDSEGSRDYRFDVEDLRPGMHRFRLRQVDLDGTATLTDAETVSVKADRRLTLSQVGPNPAQPSTRFAFAVRQQGPAELVLFNVLGQRVRTLWSKEARPGQRYTVEVSAGGLTSGAYFVRLEGPSGTQTRKFSVVR